MNAILKTSILTLATAGMLGAQGAPASGPSSRPATGPTTRSADSGGIKMPVASRPASRRARPNSEEQTKYAPTISKLLSSVSAKVSPSVAMITQNGHTLYATVVRADGYMVTKASELKSPTFDVKLSSGVTLKGKIVACATEHDLALIQVPTGNLTPVEWADPSTIKLGEMVIAPGEKSEPVGWGVLSVLKRPLTNGMMGVMFEPTGDTTVVQSVMPGMPAAKAGLKAGDVITHVNEQDFDSRSKLQEFLSGQTSGTELSVTVKRGEEHLTFRLTLVSRPPAGAGSARADMQNTGGNPLVLSERRSDFPSVLEHDIVLYPTQQGGPLVNLEGKAIGVNIARGGRVETYATPAEVIEKLLPEMIARKFPPTTHPVEVADATPALPENADGPADRNLDKETEQALIESLKKRIAAKEDELARGSNQLRAMRAELAKRLGAGPATKPTTQP